MENKKLNDLVAKWLNKPTFKMEDEPGYEEHREKLLLYRLELQGNANIRALQKKIVNEAKDQWVKFPVKSLADDPELNLFRNELREFCRQVVVERERNNNIRLLNDIRLAFLEVKALYPSRPKDEKTRLIQMYKHIDLSIVPIDTPGLDNLITEISDWIESNNANRL